MIDIRRAAGPEELRQALALRHEVFVVEQGVSAAEESDGRDGDAVHLVALAGRRVVGTCRLVLSPARAAGPDGSAGPAASDGSDGSAGPAGSAGSVVKLGRMAVARSQRRRGVASALLREAERQARTLGAGKIVLHAQTYTRVLYEAAGYRARGDIFWEAGVEHVRMERGVA